MDEQNSRAQFERFARRRDMGLDRITSGRYKSSYTQAMWESWQESRRVMNATPPAAEGEQP